jgi:hypothetical protein
MGDARNPGTGQADGGPPGAPRGLFSPDHEFCDLPAEELLSVAAGTGESVLRRGRALLELGRRASRDASLLRPVADMIRDPETRRLITVGAVPVSQLGAAGLLAGGGEAAAALARELASEWPADEQSDFAWLVSRTTR